MNNTHDLKKGEIVTCVGKDLYAVNNIKWLNIGDLYEVVDTSKAGITDTPYCCVRALKDSHIIEGVPQCFFKPTSTIDRFELQEVPRGSIWYKATIKGKEYSILNIGKMMETAPFKYEGFDKWESLDKDGNTERAETFEALIKKLS